MRSQNSTCRSWNKPCKRSVKESAQWTYGRPCHSEVLTRRSMFSKVEFHTLCNVCRCCKLDAFRANPGRGHCASRCFTSLSPGTRVPGTSDQSFIESCLKKNDYAHDLHIISKKNNLAYLARFWCFFLSRAGDVDAPSSIFLLLSSTAIKCQTAAVAPPLREWMKSKTIDLIVPRIGLPLLDPILIFFVRGR